MVRWDVDPEIFRIGIFAIRWYSLLFMASFVVGLYIMKRIFDQEKKPIADLDELLMYMLFGTIIGARLGHCLFYDPGYYLSNPIEILKVWKGGLASHGAAIGILTALFLFIKKKPAYSYLWIVDRVVITVALAGFFIRTGNLFNSEIIGRPTDLPWSFIFVKVDMIPRHPAQIYEALAYLLIFVFLYKLYQAKKEKTASGSLLGWFLIFIFGFRFFIEFLKEDQSAFEQGMLLNMGQLLSIPLIILGIYLLIRAGKKLVPGDRKPGA
ncbi:MAG: prolipoprotein diacylglyceryl transferase [Calditrichaceae bacterium]